MKPTRWLLICAAAALVTATLSGCATKLTSDDAVKLIAAYHAAGCGGSVTVDVRGGTGQLGGSASGQFTANGTCPQAPQPATVGQVVAQPLTVGGEIVQ